MKPPDGTNDQPWRIDNRKDRSYTQRITHTMGKGALTGQRWSATGFYLYETYKNTNIIPAPILEKYKKNPKKIFKGNFP